MRVGRVALINLLGLVILLLVVGIIYYIWHQGYYFYSTDDAQVSGTIVNVASTAPGVVTAVEVQSGQTVSRGSSIVALEPAPAAPTSGSSVGTTSATSVGGNGVAAPPSHRRNATVSPSAVSPIQGTVLTVSAQPGEVVQPGQPPLAQVADLSRVNITANVEETHIGDIHPGQGVDITVDALNGLTFHGRVTQIVQATAATFSLIPPNNYVSGNFTKVTQRIPVIITLDGLQGQTLYPGTSASVTIHIHT